MNERSDIRSFRVTSRDLAGINRKPSASIFGLKVAAWVLGLSVGFLGMIFGHGAILWCSAILAGAFMAHGVELSHQALHGTGFRGSRANRIVGVFLALPMFVSYSEYQASHLHHHQTLGTPDDREFWVYSDGGKPSLVGALRHLFIVNHYIHAIQSMFRSIIGLSLPNIPLSHCSRVRQEYQFMLFLICAAVGSALGTGHWDVVLAWFGALLWVAGPIHALIELPEHHGCDKTTTNVFVNTRTIKSNKFMTWFTNGNNYHVEHHAASGIPMQSLDKLHQNIYYRINVYCPTYREFYWSVVRQWIVKYARNREMEA